MALPAEGRLAKKELLESIAGVPVTLPRREPKGRLLGFMKSGGGSTYHADPECPRMPTRNTVLAMKLDRLDEKHYTRPCKYCVADGWS